MASPLPRVRRSELPGLPGRAALLLALAAAAAGCSTDGTAEGDGSPLYVGAETCAECHATEAEAWHGSDHDLAMQHPTEESVLGDFDGAVFEHDGETTRFSRSGEDFVVNAEGSDGVARDWRVAYTFGVRPLQQVLLDIGKGRLQAETVAWDAERGRWYALRPEEHHGPGDPLHWSGLYQNWNGMCAECHSTALDKGYDAATDGFHTTYEEVDVACEACHGPGSAHVAWARGRGEAGPPAEGEDVGLTVRLRRDEQAAQIDACAPCHSRRTALSAGLQPKDGFLDHYLPELLRDGTYFADGQIRDEVYVYGSFAQSKMHAKGVTCTDCHDPHTLRLRLPGNGVCRQCHSPTPPVERFESLAAKEYDTPEHHRHEPGTDGALCVNCHAPARTYMGIDPRRDHSFRIPRPDLTVSLGTPNACDDCHADKGAAWSAARIEEWFGPERPPHFAAAFAGARAGSVDAIGPVVDLVLDRDQPAIVRATGLELLRGAGTIGRDLSRGMLGDESPLVRATAVRGLESLKPVERLDPLLPLVEDPSLAVRIEAARMLAGAPAQVLEAVSEDYDRVLDEWRAAQLVSAEMPWAHHNLGSLEQDLGNTSEARKQYKRALELDPYFLPARFNLATLYNQGGRNLEAERLLREGIELVPEEGELRYSLGLLLAEVGRLGDAANSLLEAAERMPGRPRVHYNAGLALQKAGRMDEAERELLEANRLQPGVTDIVHALAAYYIEMKLWSQALPYAEELQKLAPDEKFPGELLETIRAGLAGDG